MPELPEVEITVRKFKKGGLVGHKILSFKIFSPKQFVSIFSPKEAEKDAVGRKITAIERKGKAIFIKLSGRPERALAFHLKMTGNLRSEKSESALGRFNRFYAGLGGGKRLRFDDIRKFGRIWYGASEDVLQEKYFLTLGKDILKTSPQEFFEKIRKRKGAIKPLLLRQDIFSGIGNIIADESLWMTKIHPKTSLEKLHDREIFQLHKNLRKVIKEILKAGGTSMRDWKHPDGKAGKYQNKFLVYGRKLCVKCGGKVLKIKVAGRGSSVCPRCQKLSTWSSRLFRHILRSGY